MYCPGQDVKGIRDVRLDNRKVFFVHQVQGPNILSALFVVKKTKILSVYWYNLAESLQV